MEKVYLANANQKKVVEAILIWEKVYLRARILQAIKKIIS